jgi:nucleoside-diphosphate-sugar epimerase
MCHADCTCLVSEDERRKGNVMKIFLAGATGAIGRPLIAQLKEHGHEVVGTTRSEAKAGELWDLGAKPVVVDALDRDAVVAAVAQAKPDAVIHELTALANIDFRKMEKSFELTNRLRTEGTDNLLAAARAAGVKRFVAQSYAGHPYARTGGPVKTEDDPLDPNPARQLRPTVEAIKYLEREVLEFGGIVLRYGGFYGPGTGMEPGGEQLEMVRRRRFPVVGEGRAVWSFVHIEDAAAATVVALERAQPGTLYNIVDDEPARVGEFLPYLAEVVGAKPPRRVPVWLARLMGEHMVVMMDEVRGASNEKARRELGWEPAHRSWRDGFRELRAA